MRIFEHDIASLFIRKNGALDADIKGREQADVRGGCKMIEKPNPAAMDDMRDPDVASAMRAEEAAASESTDREIWRGPSEDGCGNFYADSIFVTRDGGIGINCGGSVYVKPVREWWMLAGGPLNGSRR